MLIIKLKYLNPPAIESNFKVVMKKVFKASIVCSVQSEVFTNSYVLFVLCVIRYSLKYLEYS